MSFATRLWRDYQKGRVSLDEACRCIVRGVEEDDFERQIDSMPPEMLSAFAAFVSPTRVDESGPQWDNLSCDSIEMHAFDFQIEKVHAWKTDRLKKLHLLCQRKLSSIDGDHQAQEPRSSLRPD